MANLIEIQQLGDMLARASGGTSRNLNQLNDVLDKVNIELKKENEERVRELKSLAQYNKKYDDQRIQNIETLQKEINDRERTIQNNRSLINNYYQQEQNRTNKIKQLNDQYEAMHKNRKEILEEMTVYQYEVDRRRISNQIKSLEDQQQHINILKQSNRGLEKEIKILADTLNTQAADLDKFDWKELAGSLKHKLTGTLVDAVKKAFNPSLFAEGMKQTLDYAREVMATGGDWIYSDLERRWDIGKMGISAQEYLKMNTEHRKLILSVGGTTKMLDMMKVASQDIAQNFKSPAEAALYTTKMFDVFSKMGIKPTEDSLLEMNKTFKTLNAITGTTGDQFMTVLNDITSSDDIQTQLRMLNMQERQQMLNSIATRIKENEVIGISAEKTSDMIKAMAGFSQKTYVERAKDAQKMSLAAGAFGLSGRDQARIRELTIKGTHNMNEAEMGEFQKYGMYIMERAEQQRKLGGGREVQVDQIMDLLQSTGLFNRTNSPFAAARQAVDSQKLGNTEAEALNLKNNTQNEVPKLLRDVISIIEKIQAVVTDPIVLTAMGALGGLAAYFGGKGILKAATKQVGKLGGKLAGGVGKSPKALSTIATGAGAAGAKAVAGEAAEATTKAAVKAAVKTGGSTVSKSISKKIPIIGALIGLGFGVGRLIDGDLTGALMEAGSGLASTVPIYGTAASFGLDAALLARDMQAATPVDPDTKTGVDISALNQEMSRSLDMGNNAADLQSQVIANNNIDPLFEQLISDDDTTEGLSELLKHHQQADFVTNDLLTTISKNQTTQIELMTTIRDVLELTNVDPIKLDNRQRWMLNPLR